MNFGADGCLMKTSWKFWAADLLLIGLIGAALAQEKTTPPAPAKAVTAQKTFVTAPETKAPLPSDLRIVGYIEKRDRTIVIKASSKGPFYTVKGPDGKVLFENFSAEQLRAQAPELHDFIKTAVAGADAKNRVKIDAGMSSSMR